MDEELKRLLAKNIKATEANSKLLRKQNALLVAIVAQNADLIDVLHSDAGPLEQDQPTTDLAGRPL